MSFTEASAFYDIKSFGMAYVEFKKAANKGCVKSLTMLGVMRKNGEGADQNIAVACMHFEKASDAGDAVAQYNLAVLEGQDGNREQSDKLFKQSADQGYAPANYILGRRYYAGGNTDLATECFLKAAEKDHTESKYYLGVILYKTNPKESVKWFEQAAEQNHEDSLGYLSHMYYQGFKVERDEVKAKQYADRKLKLISARIEKEEKIETEVNDAMKAAKELMQTACKAKAKALDAINKAISISGRTEQLQSMLEQLQR